MTRSLPYLTTLFGSLMLIASCSLMLIASCSGEPMNSVDQSTYDYDIINMRSTQSRGLATVNSESIRVSDFVTISFEESDETSDRGYAFVRMGVVPNEEYVWKVEISCLSCETVRAKLNWYDGVFHPLMVDVGPNISTHYIDIKSKERYVNVYVDNRDTQSTAKEISARFTLRKK